MYQKSVYSKGASAKLAYSSVQGPLDLALAQVTVRPLSPCESMAGVDVCRGSMPRCRSLTSARLAFLQFSVCKKVQK